MTWYTTLDGYLGGLLPGGAPVSPWVENLYGKTDDTLLGLLPGGTTPFQAIGNDAKDLISPLVGPLLPIVLIAAVVLVMKK